MNDLSATTTLANCPHCDSTFLVSPEQATAVCPFCARDTLVPLDTNAENSQAIYTQPPELTLPFTIPDSKQQAILTNFAKKTWFAPSDLSSEQLQARLQKLYLPMWLVDAHATAQWQAEVGFDYQVVSHRENYKDGNWHTQQVKETKIRWEPRVGTLQRQYDNQPAPALEEQLYLEKALGRYRYADAQPYQSETISGIPIRLPNRPPDDAWSEAQAGIKQVAAQECQQASSADHIREYRWVAQFQNHNWTQLLYPLYTTYYQDDMGTIRRIYIHGQHGKVIGERYASMKKARQWALIIAIIAGIGFFLSLALGGASFVWDQLLSVALLFLLGSVGLGVAAVLPLIAAWYANTFKYAAENKLPFLKAQ